MNFLFYDLEYATSKGGICKICEFGYVVTNEKFKILERNNLIINPNITRREWDYRVVRKILTRTIDEYEKKHNFNSYYTKIKELISNADFIIGHSLNGDAKALNDECQRYDKPSIDYDFYDIKEIYREYSNTKKATSVNNILINLGIEGEDNAHDAETDAYNTMLELKAMIDYLGLSFQEIITICPNSKDRTENYIVKSIEENRIKKMEELEKFLSGNESNDIRKGDLSYKIFLKYLDYIKPNLDSNGVFNQKKISISINYEEHHFRQVLKLIKMIADAGGQVILKASLADIFVQYDEMMDDGTLRNDSRLEYVKKAIQDGANIQIITFDELLQKLNITEVELDSKSVIQLDWILQQEVNNIKKKSNQLNYKEINKLVYSSGNQKETLGDLFGDLFNKIKNDL